MVVQCFLASSCLTLLQAFCHPSGCHLWQEQLLHWNKFETETVLDSGVLCLCYILAMKGAMTSRGCSRELSSWSAAGAECGSHMFSCSPPARLSVFFSMTIFSSCGALPCRCHLSPARRRRWLEFCRPPKTTAASPPQTWRQRSAWFSTPFRPSRPCTSQSDPSALRAMTASRKSSTTSSLSSAPHALLQRGFLTAESWALSLSSLPRETWTGACRSRPPTRPVLEYWKNGSRYFRSARSKRLCLKQPLRPWLRSPEKTL